MGSPGPWPEKARLRRKMDGWLDCGAIAPY